EIDEVDRPLFIVLPAVCGGPTDFMDSRWGSMVGSIFWVSCVVCCSVHRSVCLPVCLPVCSSVCLSVRPLLLLHLLLLLLVQLPVFFWLVSCSVYAGPAAAGATMMVILS
ncbi:unnamed protein product, partial [Scytosiphon promiscuus]